MHTLPKKSRVPILAAIAALLFGVSWILFLRPKSESSGSASIQKVADPMERTREYLERIARDPADSEAHLQIGLLNEENGHFMAAIESLRAAEKCGYHGSELDAALGRCLSRLGRYKEAGKQLERALSARRDDTKSAIELASVLAKRGKKEEALRQLKHSAGLVIAGPGSEPHILSLARSFEGLGDLDSALTWSEGTVRAAPTVAEGHFIAGRVLLKMHRTEEASVRLVRAVELQPESHRARELLGDAIAAQDKSKSGALERWLEAIELGSSRPETYYRAADALARRGDITRSAEILTRAGVRTVEKAKAFTLAAAAWTRAGDADQSLYCHATASAAAGDIGKALSAYKLLAANPRREWKKRGLDGTAEMYRLMKRPKEYLAAAREAAFTGTAADDMRLANAYLLMGDRSRREEYLRRAMNKDPGLKSIVYLELAAIPEARGSRDSAIKLYEQAVEADPGNTDALLGLSRLVLQGSPSKEQIANAVDLAARAAAVSPGSWQAFRQLGIACSRAGSPLRAKQALQHTIDLNPRNPDSYRLLAAELRKLGEESAAEAESHVKEYESEKR